MRPTGRLHLGNYMGALFNWVQLQHQYDCYFFIADLHALTTNYADPGEVQENCIDLVGRIADRGAEFVSGREWMRICFELLDMLKVREHFFFLLWR